MFLLLYSISLEGSAKINRLFIQYIGASIRKNSLFIYDSPSGRERYIKTLLQQYHSKFLQHFLPHIVSNVEMSKVAAFASGNNGSNLPYMFYKVMPQKLGLILQQHRAGKKKQVKNKSNQRCHLFPSTLGQKVGAIFCQKMLKKHGIQM